MAKPRIIEDLDCAAPVDAAARRILQVRWDEVGEYCTHAGDNPTVDAVHDARVATRRLRGAYRDFRPFLRARALRRAMKEVSTLAALLGAVRDHDVAMATLNQLADGLSPGMRRDGILLLAAERRPLRNAAAEKLMDLVSHSVFDDFCRAMATAFDEIKPPKRSAGDRIPTFREAGGIIIAKSYRRLVKRGRALFDPQRPVPLHDLRIAAKRLRYALQLFSVCWGGELTALAREVSQLQDALGALHDCDVWTAELGKRLKKFNEQREAPTSEIERAVNVASLWLLGRFTRDRAKHFRDALVLWQRWEADDFGGRLSRILDHDGA